MRGGIGSTEKERKGQPKERERERELPKEHNTQERVGKRRGWGTYVFIDVVQTTIAGNEAGDLLSVLDELHTDALTNSGVRLFGLNTTVNERNNIRRAERE